MPESLLELQEVRRSFGTVVVTEVLHGIDLKVRAGEFIAIIGASGSGKSTLLNQIGLLDRPTSGEVILQGRKTSALSDDEITRLRNEDLGFIFQFHHLISALTAEENLTLPLAIRDGGIRKEHRTRARELLDAVGLGDRNTAAPLELSGGQQQRVSIARALMHRPPLILADEPTGNLDSVSADDVFRLMRRINEEEKTSFVIVTHDPKMAQRTDRVIVIEDGRISEDGPPDQVMSGYLSRLAADS